MTTTTDLKYIGYDRLTRDFMATFDGQLIGYFANYSAAEDALNDYVLGLCVQGLIDTPLTALAADPDPGSDCDDHGPYADDECPKCRAPWISQGPVVCPVCVERGVCACCAGEHRAYSCPVIAQERRTQGLVTRQAQLDFIHAAQRSQLEQIGLRDRATLRRYQAEPVGA